MADLHGFNANDVDPGSGFEPLPEGSYVAMITNSEMKPTKNGDGSYLQITFQVLEGECKDRYAWARLNLHNRNETAVKIARAQLSSLCRAVGVLTPKDSCELHNLPLVIKVRCKKDKQTNEVTNDIRGFAKKEALNGQAPKGGPAPWQKKS